MKHSDPSLISKVLLSVQFEMNHPDDSVDVEFWYTSNDDKSLTFVKNMRDYVLPLARSK